MILSREFYQRDTVKVARDLLCKILFHKTPKGSTSGRIVEVEAYLVGDEKSHAFRGRTERNKVMFGEAGFAYVYQIYGVHHCLNVVTQKIGVPEAILIRALEPLKGIELMKERRGNSENLTNGPARLCQAMGIDLSFNGVDLTEGNLVILDSERRGKIYASKRIGVGRDERFLRFFLKL
ncbi:MAG: DNA-3-methyladenine glycosylase [Candidatus Methanofastidiosia archaeon]